MADREPPFSVTLDRGAPPDPSTVLEVAEAVEVAAEVLALQTRHHEALHFPEDGTILLRHLSAAAAGFGQVAVQVAAWYVLEAAKRGPDMDAAVVAARANLARMAGEEFSRALDSLAEATAQITEGGSDG